LNQDRWVGSACCAETQPVVNKHIPDLETLEAIISERSAHLANDRQTLKGRTGFHWWPPIANAT